MILTRNGREVTRNRESKLRFDFFFYLLRVTSKKKSLSFSLSHKEDTGVIYTLPAEGYVVLRRNPRDLDSETIRCFLAGFPRRWRRGGTDERPDAQDEGGNVKHREGRSKVNERVDLKWKLEGEGSRQGGT